MSLLTRDDCWHHIGLRGVNAHTDCGGVAINSFNQVLHHTVATAECHDVLSRGSVIAWLPDGSAHLVQSGSQLHKGSFPSRGYPVGENAVFGGAA